MRFQVPQFIEVEDKIIGPFTLKQFIYLAGTAGIIVVLYNALPKFLAFFLIIPMGGLGIALAFWKINNKPFIEILEAAFKYLAGGKLYIWKKQDPKVEIAEEIIREKAASSMIPRMSGSKLKELTWNLDIKEQGAEIRRYKDSNLAQKTAEKNVKMGGSGE